MGGSRPTPRDIPAVPPPPKPSQDETPVIPIHGRATPPRPVESQHVPGEPRRASVPTDNRPWRLLVVPPTPGAPTRAFNVRRWQAKLAVWAIGILLFIAALGVLAGVVTIRDQQPAPSDAEVEDLRTNLLALEDSIAL